MLYKNLHVLHPRKLCSLSHDGMARKVTHQRVQKSGAFRERSKTCHFGPRALFWLKYHYIISFYLPLHPFVISEPFTPHKALASVVHCYSQLPNGFPALWNSFFKFVTFKICSSLLVVGSEEVARNVQLTFSFAPPANPKTYSPHWPDRVWDGCTSDHSARPVYYSLFAKETDLKGCEFLWGLGSVELTFLSL